MHTYAFSVGDMVTFESGFGPSLPGYAVLARRPETVREPQYIIKHLTEGYRRSAGEYSLRRDLPDLVAEAIAAALSRWENEGGAACARPPM